MLESRLGEARALSHDASPWDRDTCADVEEELRLLMVRDLPLARSGRQSWDLVLARVRRVDPLQDLDDPRFLDAWNCVYEGLVAAGIQEDAFAATYSAVLEELLG